MLFRSREIIDSINTFSTSIPFQNNTVTINVRDDTSYDKAGRVISYKERNFTNGIAKETIWSVDDMIDDIANWLNSRIKSLRESIKLLNTYRQQAVIQEDQSFVDELSAKIFEAEAEVLEFEKLVPFVSEAKTKINRFYSLVNENADDDVLKEAHNEI